MSSKFKTIKKKQSMRHLFTTNRTSGEIGVRAILLPVDANASPVDVILPRDNKKRNDAIRTMLECERMNACTNVCDGHPSDAYILWVDHEGMFGMNSRLNETIKSTFGAIIGGPAVLVRSNRSRATLTLPLTVTANIPSSWHALMRT